MAAQGFGRVGRDEDTGKRIAYNRDGNFRWNIGTRSSRLNRVRY